MPSFRKSKVHIVSSTTTPASHLPVSFEYITPTKSPTIDAQKKHPKKRKRRCCRIGRIACTTFRRAACAAYCFTFLPLFITLSELIFNRTWKSRLIGRCHSSTHSILTDFSRSTSTILCTCTTTFTQLRLTCSISATFRRCLTTILNAA